jgi:hypothetical protein
MSTFRKVVFLSSEIGRHISYMYIRPSVGYTTCITWVTHGLKNSRAVRPAIEDTS